jgi:hypothetical protein
MTGIREAPNRGSLWSALAHGRGTSSAEELEQIKRFIEETDIDTIDDEMPALVETHWPWLLGEAAATEKGRPAEADATRPGLTALGLSFFSVHPQ